MSKLPDHLKAAYLKQRPDRKIIDAETRVAPDPAAEPDAGTPDLSKTSRSSDKLAALRERFLGSGEAGADTATDVRNDHNESRRRRSRFVVTDVDGQIKTDLIDEETGDIEMEQG